MRIVTEKGKGKRIISLLLAIVCFISLLLAKGSIKALLILVTGILTLGFLRVEFKNEKLQKGLFCVVFLIAPIVTFFIGQFMQEVAFGHVSFTCVLLNAGIILLFQLIVLLLSKDLRKSIALGCVVPSLATLVNAYVFMFRGNALTPSDLLSLRTAANVAAEYVFTPTMPMLYAMILVALLVLGVYCLPQQAVARTKWNMIGQISIIAVCAIALIYGGAKQKPYHWHNDGAVINGFLLNFSLQIRETFTPKPKGYNTETIEALEEEYTKETNPAVSYPDIIVIMDESFADLDVFEKRLSTNMEVTPFMDTLQEDTIRGYLYASVFGGSTANSEYEFLSGNTMAFFPQGSIVYQQFFSENAYTIVSILKENGYECVAMHPYHANGWLRESVYPKMGFDETYFLEDFPQKKLIREYVSDQEMFDYIIDYHEQHDEGAPLFLFGVTMQNHGGYSYIGENYEPIIYLEGYSRDYPDVE